MYKFHNFLQLDKSNVTNDEKDSESQEIECSLNEEDMEQALLQDDEEKLEEPEESIINKDENSQTEAKSQGEKNVDQTAVTDESGQAEPKSEEEKNIERMTVIDEVNDDDQSNRSEVSKLNVYVNLHDQLFV